MALSRVKETAQRSLSPGPRMIIFSSLYSEEHSRNQLFGKAKQQWTLLDILHPMKAIRRAPACGSRNTTTPIHPMTEPMIMRNTPKKPSHPPVLYPRAAYVLSAKRGATSCAAVILSNDPDSSNRHIILKQPARALADDTSRTMVELYFGTLVVFSARDCTYGPITVRFWNSVSLLHRSLFSPEVIK